MSIYPPILLGRTIIAPKMPPSDKKGYLYKKILYFRFGNRVASGASAKVGFHI